MFPSALPSSHKSELTLLLMPIRYGLLWGIMISITLIYIVKYCFYLIKQKHFNTLYKSLGLSFLGFFLVYMSNLHYPSFNLHGNIELFFIMAAALVSTIEFFHKEKMKIG